MNKFPIRRVDRSLAESVEPLGSKPKFWFRDGDRRLLFKADDRGTGEDWAEVVACHLSGLLGLPHVEYGLATECNREQDIRPGVVCENIAPPPISLVLGNELLLSIDPDYPTAQRSKVQQHTVAAVSGVVSTLKPPSDAWMAGVGAGIESALDVFVGYAMLDAWIANPDRHHENWGALLEGDVMRLAPTFDHGSSLARNLLDRAREERLTTRDRNQTVLAFVERGRSTFFGSTADKKPLGLLEAFLAFAELAPIAASSWLDRLRGVKSEDVWGILERVTATRMSGICRRFTMELLLTNQRRLLG